MTQPNNKINTDEQIKAEALKFKKVLALVSFKIYERFKTIKNAFRFFDNDHTQTLTLNEFA